MKLLCTDLHLLLYHTLVHTHVRTCGLCSYRVSDVGGSRAEHLTVEFYTIIISLQSYLLSHLLLSVFHHPLTLSFQA